MTAGFIGLQPDVTGLEKPKEAKLSLVLRAISGEPMDSKYGIILYILSCLEHGSRISSAGVCSCIIYLCKLLRCGCACAGPGPDQGVNCVFCYFYMFQSCLVLSIIISKYKERFSLYSNS